MMANTTTAPMGRTGAGFGPVQIAIIILVALTALVHLFLGVESTIGGIWILAFLFLCNFGGYVVLATALYAPMVRRFQSVTRALLIGQTALTVVAYFVLAGSHPLNPIGLFDKAVEAALIVLLVIEGRRVQK